MPSSPIGIMPRATGDRGLVDYAVSAEERGFHTVWLSEGWAYDAFVKLTEIACRTDEVRLGTSIVNVFTRSPALLAMGCASLAEVSDGRFVLGLGASHPELIEDLHGLSYDAPIGRVYETADLVKRFTVGGKETVEYDGKIFDVSGYPPLEADVSIFNAAQGPANRRVTGKLFDGWIPFNTPLTELDEAFETVAAAARELDRDPDAITVAPWIPAAVSDDGEAARDAIRENVARYVGGFGAYERAVATTFPDEADRIASHWADGDEETAVGAVTDEMVDALGVAGTPEEARARFREFVDDPLIDHPILTAPLTAGDEIVARTFEELAPDRL